MKFTLGSSVGPFQGGKLFWFGPLFSDGKDVNSSLAYHCQSLHIERGQQFWLTSSLFVTYSEHLKEALAKFHIHSFHDLLCPLII
jgi:hypothetical protein